MDEDEAWPENGRVIKQSIENELKKSLTDGLNEIEKHIKVLSLELYQKQNQLKNELAHDKRRNMIRSLTYGINHREKLIELLREWRKKVLIELEKLHQQYTPRRIKAVADILHALSQRVARLESTILLTQ